MRQRSTSKRRIKEKDNNDVDYTEQNVNIVEDKSAKDDGSADSGAISKKSSWPTTIALYIDAILLGLIAYALTFHPDSSIRWYSKNEFIAINDLVLHQTVTLGSVLFIIATTAFMMAGTVSREARVVMCYMIAYGLLFANILVFSSYYVRHGSVLRGIARGPFRIEAVLQLRFWMSGFLIILNSIVAFYEEGTQGRGI